MKKILPILLVLIAGIAALYVILEEPGVPDWKDRAYSVPDFVGLSLEEAKKKVEKTKGLVLDKIVRKESTRASGIVFGQKPAPGDSFEPGDKVTLYVAYEEVITIPDFTGLSLEEARARIEKLNLLAEIVPVESDEPLGRIISPGTEERTTIEPGMRITLYVAIPEVLPELTELVREILENRHTSEETIDFVLRGRLDPQESSRSEDTGRVYICQLIYKVYAFTSRHVRLMGPIDGSIRKWAYDKDRAKEFALKELAKEVAKKYPFSEVSGRID